MYGEKSVMWMMILVIGASLLVSGDALRCYVCDSDQLKECKTEHFNETAVGTCDSVGNSTDALKPQCTTVKWKIPMGITY